MFFQYYEVNKLPVIIIDDFYDPKACERIWQELCFLSNHESKFKTPDQSGGAWKMVGEEKVYLKQNKCIFLDQTYLDRSISNILTENRKIFSEEVTDKLESYNQFFKYVRMANADRTLMSYYEDSDYYEPHIDNATITVISWFFKNPKAFQGGDLMIENQIKVECIHNRTVVIPSVLHHAVDPIKIDKNLVGENCGRYAISQFMSYNV